VNSAAYASIPGSRKVAILMIAIGEDAASAICQNLGEDEMQVITRELAEIKAVAPDLMQEVMEEYRQLSVTQEYLSQGGIHYAETLLVKAFGEEMAKNLLQKVVRLQEMSVSKLDSLQKADPAQLARFLENEHPQTVALILAHLDAKAGAALLMKLPEQVRGEAVKRLAQLRQFSPEMAEKVSVVLNRRLQSMGEQSRRTYAGFKSVAELMNRLDPAGARTILEAIDRDQPQLAINIRNLMFTFEDFVTVNEVGIRELLSHLDKKTLALALKGASEELRSHIFRSMSSRAVEMLKEDMDALGPVRTRDVGKAQQEAVAIARKLEMEGKITLKAESDDEYVV
jgi:flagellar motor switch protein FliG